MGYVDICVHIHAPDFEPKIKQLLHSLSLGIGFHPTSKETIHLVLMTPDAPEWFADSIEFPEWGKSICKKLYKLKIKDPSKVVEWKNIVWHSHDLKLYFYHERNHQLFIGFLSEKEKKTGIVLSRISGYIYFLSIFWHAKHNGLLLHSAAVDYKGSGYLFLGEGGAGKSTAALFGAAIGAKVLSDDLAFVINRGYRKYELAAAPGPSSRLTMAPKLHPQLKGIYRLVKDNRDRLIPLSSPAIAHAIFRSFEWSHWITHLPAPIVFLAFHTACDIARQVKGFELHFRKSPDFWKLIDERFVN